MTDYPPPPSGGYPPPPPPPEKPEGAGEPPSKPPWYKAAPWYAWVVIAVIVLVGSLPASQGFSG